MRKLLIAVLFALPFVALAAPENRHARLQNMTCGLCPITVKKSLEKVSGVVTSRSISTRRRRPSPTIPIRPSPRH